jgi:DNA repair protein RadC
MTPTAPEIPQGALSPRSARKAPSAKLQPGQHACAIPRYRVMLGKESLAQTSPIMIRDSQTAYRLIALLFAGLDREHFMVVGLDAKHAVIGINTVSIGSVIMSREWPPVYFDHQNQTVEVRLVSEYLEEDAWP